TASEINPDYLRPLEWLIGDWVSEDNGAPVKVTAKWALDKRFLVQDYSVAGEAGTEMRVTQWIGYDPLTGQIKSWTFDSRGGYGEGLWSREDDNTWSIDTTGVLPDGRTGTANDAVRFVDNSHYGSRATARNVEGQPLPDVEVRFVRSDAKEKVDSP